uniref:Uncharacterized protein n=1 Tax=Ascaris lumbricoides TaxID=6252 RepID=A0A0M3IJN3_ASCLU
MIPPERALFSTAPRICYANASKMIESKMAGLDGNFEKVIEREKELSEDTSHLRIGRDWDGAGKPSGSIPRLQSRTNERRDPETDKEAGR